MISKLSDIPRWRDSRQTLRGLPSRYRIERELGRGGMAVVYLARDRQLDREVAIKVLHASLSADRGSIARLSHEARLVAQVQHPNIVSIFDLEPLKDRSVALVMQYVKGRTLRTVIDETGPLPIRTAEKILGEIASALGAAHRRGIVHRDVKPENIYLDQESGRALLADFGIARSPRLDQGLTLAGEALGTPNYMSPEQIVGGELDGRSDLYSLGLVGYEMLTGERPWNGESLYQVLHKQQHANLPPLKHRRPETPEYLRTTIDQVLRKDRTHRPASADLFIESLREGIDNAPPEVVEPDPEPAEATQEEASPNAPTIRYRRSQAAANATPDVEESSTPEWLLRLQEETASPVGAAPAPVKHTPERVTLRPDPPDVPHEAASPEPVVDLKWSDLHTTESRKPAKRSTKILTVIGGTVAAAVLVVAIGMAGLSGDTGADTPTDPAAELAQPEDVPPSEINQPSGGSPPPVAAPAPRRSPVARESYQPSGDLTDIFCRPTEAETVEQWRRRVPDYCLARTR